MIENITKTLEEAFRSDASLFFCAEIWPEANSVIVDSQADFEDYAAAANMDFTTRPNYAQLALVSKSISQTTHDSNAPEGETRSGSYTGHPASQWQSFTMHTAGWLGNISVAINNFLNGPTTGEVSIYEQTKAAALATRSFTAANNTLVTDVQVITKDFSGVYLEAGVYWLKVQHTGDDYSSSLTVFYKKSDVYADGQMDSFGYPTLDRWTANIGDMYFVINYKTYKKSGSFSTKRLDVGATPGFSGRFRSMYQIPAGTDLQIDLYGFAAGDDVSPAWTLLDAVDDIPVPSLRYWEISVSMTSNPSQDKTPLIDVLEVRFPKDRLLLRENIALRRADESRFKDYQPLLQPIAFTPSQIKVLDRVSSGGDASAVLRDPDGSVISRLISDSPLMNRDAILYIGADVPNMSESDLLEFFVGTIKTSNYIPRYRRPFASLNLTFQNILLALDQKVPVPTSSGKINYSQIGLNYDGTHVMDCIKDILRSQAGMPARHVSMASFDPTAVGDGLPPAAAYVVRRAYTAGLPDTRIKEPLELRELLKPLALIADGYIIVDEQNRLAFIKHDLSKAHEETWADETIVREGTDAVPIFDVSAMDQGFDSRLFNICVLGCGWDGAKDDWSAFTTYATVNLQSAQDYGPGADLFFSILEKPMREAAKWLGPEDGYNGETLSAALTKRMTDRFSYPPVIMSGVQVPMSQYKRTVGSVVRVWSREFCKFKRRGIALSETLTFMVIMKRLDRSNKRMVFDLLELT